MGEALRKADAVVESTKKVSNLKAVDNRKPVLKVTGLGVSFPKSGDIFKGLDVTIYDGEQVCIVGSNGAGKSTLCKACLGIVPSQAGTVELLGETYQAKKGPPKKLLAKVGMVHQKHNLMSNGTALTNVIHGALGRVKNRAGLWYQNFAPQEIREQALEYLNKVGLIEFADRKAGELSGGQSQRVAIARALMQKPDIIIADEPVASLDPKSGLIVMEQFSKICAEEGATLIFVSHHLDHAVKFSNRIIGIQHKQIGFDVKSDETTLEELETIYG